MTMKLRYYLLGLFVIGLSFFGFSEAGYRQIGNYGYNEYNSNYDIAVIKNGLPLTQKLGLTKNLFLLNNDLMWWRGYNGVPYVYMSDSCQGYISTYYVCTATSDSISFNTCSQSSVYDDSPSIWASFFSSMTNEDSYYYSYSKVQYTRSYRFCFINSSLNKALCIINYSMSNRNCPDGTINAYTGSMDLTNINFDSISTTLLYNPPSISSSGGNNLNSDIIYTYSGLILTNSGVYQGLLDMGFYKDICYGDYNSGSLIDSSLGVNQFFDGGDCEDGQLYCGLSIPELFELSNNGNITRTPISWFNNFYNLFKLSYEKDSYGSWNGRYKALWKTMFKVYNNDFNSNFNGQDYLTFCKMTKDILDGNFDGGSTYNEDDYPITDNTESHIIEKRKQKDLQNQFVLSGTSTENGTTLFDMFNNLYSRAKDTFKPSSSHSSDSGILPNYIVFGFLLMVLLYGLKR